MPSLYEMLRLPASDIDRVNLDKLYGVYVALVVDNKCPQGLYRCKVTFPWQMNDDETSHWARICTVGAGNQTGFFILPEVGTQVLVAFEDGEIAYPFIIGALWNDEQRPRLANSKQDGANNIQQFTSRSGHTLEFDNTDGGEKITLQTKDGAVLCLDDGAKKCSLVDSQKQNELHFDTAGKSISLVSKGDILIKSDKTLTLDCQTLSVTSSGDSSFKATNYAIKAKANLNANAAQADMSAEGPLKINGSQVRINC